MGLSLTILSRSSTSFNHEQWLGSIDQRFSGVLDGLRNCFIDCFEVCRKLLD
jgi:hypothetical protein